MKQKFTLLTKASRKAQLVLGAIFVVATLLLSFPLQASAAGEKWVLENGRLTSNGGIFNRELTGRCPASMGGICANKAGDTVSHTNSSVTLQDGSWVIGDNAVSAYVGVIPDGGLWWVNDDGFWEGIIGGGEARICAKVSNNNVVQHNADGCIGGRWADAFWNSVDKQTTAPPDLSRDEAQARTECSRSPGRTWVEGTVNTPGACLTDAELAERRMAEATNDAECTEAGGVWTDNECVNQNCDNSPDITPGIRFMACPALDATGSSLNDLDININNLLEFDVDGFEEGGARSGWEAFRIIAYALILIAGLVVVIGQALGVQILDAYTIKKAVPRLLVATLFIALSWDILIFLVQFVNTLGWGLQDLLLAPFGDAVAEMTFVKTLEIAAGVGIGLTGGLLYLVISLGFAGTMALLGTALLSLIIGLIVVAIRTMLIIICLIVAPLAIACMVLPATQKLWNMWQNTLTTALVIFPIITMLIAAGKIGADLVGGGSAGWMAIIFYVAPYALIPFTFKFAGGLIGRIANVANNPGKGAFDRLRGVRENTSAQRAARLKSGGLWDPNKKSTQMLGGNIVNSLGRRAGVGMQGKFGGIGKGKFGQVGRAAMGNAMLSDAGAYAKEDSNFGAQINDEGVMAAVMLGNDRAKLAKLKYFQDENGNVKETDLNRVMVGASTIKINPRAQTAAADALAQSGKILTSRDEAEMAYDAASQGNSALRGAVKGQYQYTSRKIGRQDIGRDTDLESLQEMDGSTTSRQKPVALDNLLAKSSTWEPQEQSDGSKKMVQVERPAFLHALHQADAKARKNPADAAKMQTIKKTVIENLYSSLSSPYTSPEAKARVESALAQVANDPTYGGLAAEVRQSFESRRMRDPNDPTQGTGQLGD
jgi:hypothetical protein